MHYFQYTYFRLLILAFVFLILTSCQDSERIPPYYNTASPIQELKYSESQVPIQGIIVNHSPATERSVIERYSLTGSVIESFKADSYVEKVQYNFKSDIMFFQKEITPEMVESDKSVCTNIYYFDASGNEQIFAPEICKYYKKDSWAAQQHGSYLVTVDDAYSSAELAVRVFDINTKRTLRECPIINYSHLSPLLLSGDEKYAQILLIERPVTLNDYLAIEYRQDFFRVNTLKLAQIDLENCETYYKPAAYQLNYGMRRVSLHPTFTISKDWGLLGFADFIAIDLLDGRVVTKVNMPHEYWSDWPNSNYLAWSNDGELYVHTFHGEPVKVFYKKTGETKALPVSTEEGDIYRFIPNTHKLYISRLQTSKLSNEIFDLDSWTLEPARFEYPNEFLYPQ